MKKMQHYLTLAEVPEELHAQCLASLKDARNRSLKTLPWQLAAPFVMAIVSPFLKWEADALPRWARKWDVEPLLHIDINGDAKPRTPTGMVDGIQQYDYDPVPLEDTDAARSLCYWARDWRSLFRRKAHPRQNWARFKYLGLRNKAQMVDYDAGEPYDESARFWIQRDLPGYDIVIFQMGSHWQVQVKHRFWGPLAWRINRGFAISNIHWGEKRTRDGRPVRASVKYSWFGIRWWKDADEPQEQEAPAQQ